MRADRVSLAHEQLAIAREYGFPSWPKLVSHVEAVADRAFPRRPFIRPVELAPDRRFTLAHGGDASTDEVFAMFVAARDGDIETARRLAGRGQRAMVELLLDRGADPVAAGAPWAAPLAWAEKRDRQDIADPLRATGATDESG